MSLNIVERSELLFCNAATISLKKVHMKPKFSKRKQNEWPKEFEVDYEEMSTVTYNKYPVL